MAGPIKGAPATEPRGPLDPVERGACVGHASRMISPSHPTEPAAVSLFREAVKLATSTHRQAVTSTAMLGAACVICRIAGATTLQARAHELATKALSQSSRALASALGPRRPQMTKVTLPFPMAASSLVTPMEYAPPEMVILALVV